MGPSLNAPSCAASHLSPSSPAPLGERRLEGDVDPFDFLCFQGEFTAQTPYADREQDGDWDLFDFLCYQQLYFNGCG